MQTVKIRYVPFNDLKVDFHSTVYLYQYLCALFTPKSLRSAQAFPARPRIADATIYTLSPTLMFVL